MKLKAFNKEKEYKKLKRNNKAKITYITSLFSVCIIAMVVTFILTNSFAFKSSDSFTLVDATTKLVWDYAYTGTAQEFIVPSSGYYNIELWGSQGQNFVNDLLGGKGGYVKGTISLAKGEKIYVYVSSQNEFIGTNVFNATGCDIPNILVPTGCIIGSLENGDYRSGGGAVDIRLATRTNWYDSVSLRSRIMVASGGGGAQFHNGVTTDGVIGGNGGGLIGSNVNGATGARQTTGYAFGISRPAASSQSWTPGGSGYYGGFSTSDALQLYGAAGGSSYISGYAGVNSIQETGGTATQPLHTNNTIHYSGKYFISGSMEAGVNNGNGKAKITYISSTIPQRTNTKLDNVRYIKNCLNENSVSGYNHWVQIQAIKDGVNIAKGKTVTATFTPYRPRPTEDTLDLPRLVDGIIDQEVYVVTTVNAGNHCVTVDLGGVYNLDEVALWLPWWATDARIYKDNILSVGSTNISGTTSLSTILHNYPGTDGYVETSQGRRYSAWD